MLARVSNWLLNQQGKHNCPHWRNSLDAQVDDTYGGFIQTSLKVGDLMLEICIEFLQRLAVVGLGTEAGDAHHDSAK